MQHDWIRSTLGHGETMCSRCFVTNREAAAIGMLECDVPAHAPANGATANENWPQDRIDAEVLSDDDRDEDEDDGGEDCGRWWGGKLIAQCSKAGSEECDWNCPIGLPHRVPS